METNEQEWALALKKKQQQSAYTQQQPASVRRQTAEQKFAQAKQSLARACFSDDKTQLELNFQRAVQARADVMQVRLEQLEEQFGTVSARVVEQHTNAYLQDCAVMYEAVQTCM